MQWIRDMVYDPRHKDACTLDLCLPEGGRAKKVFLYFHGGGLESGDKTDLGACAGALAERGLAVASANYRMYPDARFPDYIEDAASAAAWVAGAFERYGFEELYIGGSSAGGYLAMMLYFDRRYLSRHGLDPESVAGYLFDAGQPTTHFHVLRERGLDPRLVRVDEAAPLFFLREPAQGGLCPRFLILLAEQDIPGRLEQTMLLRQNMLQFGYHPDAVTLRVMQGCGHCQYTGNEDFTALVADFARL